MVPIRRYYQYFFDIIHSLYITDLQAAKIKQSYQVIENKILLTWVLFNTKADRLDMWPDGSGLHLNKNRYRRLDERAGSGRVQDLEVLLQDGFRYERNKERGSSVGTTAEVLHVQIKGGTGTHSLPEFRECGNGGKRNDKGHPKQTGG